MAMTDPMTLAPAFMVDDASVLAETDMTRCILLMTVGHHQFGYAVLDPLHKRFITLKSYYYGQKNAEQTTLDVIEQCLDMDKMLFTAFQETRIGFDVPCHTLVPASYYHPSDRREYLSFLYGPQTDHVIMHDVLQEWNMVNVYGLNKNIVGYLRKEFSTGKICHTETAGFRSLLSQQELTEEPLFYVRILPHRLVFSAFLNKRLQYHQSFPFGDEQDVVYQLLNVLQQLGWDINATEIRLHGEINESSRVYQELERFVPRLHWAHRLHGYTFVPSFNNYPAHHFRNILSLAACE